MQQWPNVKSKIKFREASRWFWFTNMVKDAEELLEPGKEYTVSSLSLGSSWCGVVLEELPEHQFSLSWFEYPRELTTEEVKEFETGPGARRCNIEVLETRRKERKENER